MTILRSLLERVLAHEGALHEKHCVEVGENRYGKDCNCAAAPLIADIRAALQSEPTPPRCLDRIFGLQCEKPEGHEGPHVSEPVNRVEPTSKHDWEHLGYALLMEPPISQYRCRRCKAENGLTWPLPEGPCEPEGDEVHMHSFSMGPTVDVDTAPEPPAPPLESLCPCNAPYDEDDCLDAYYKPGIKCRRALNRNVPHE